MRFFEKLVVAYFFWGHPVYRCPLKAANRCIETLHRPHRRLKYSQPADVATLTV